MSMPGRTYQAGSYRYGFNGKENDNEVKGTSNQQDYGMRIYDPRLGRFLSVDPLTSDYPSWSPYPFAMNRPIDGIDLDGLEWQPVNLAGENVGADSKDIRDYRWVGFNVDGKAPEGSVASGTVKWKGSTWSYNSDSKYRDGTISIQEDNADNRSILVNSDNTARRSTDGRYVGEDSWRGTQAFDVRGMRGGEMNSNLESRLRECKPTPGNADYVPVEAILVPLPSADVILFGRVANAGRVFWTGGRAFAGAEAEAYAISAGKTTLSMTTVGKILDKLPYNSFTKPIFNYSSKVFASGARGSADIFIDYSKTRAVNTLFRYEMPRLLKNKVTFTINP